MNTIQKLLIIVFTIASMSACKKDVITIENNNEPEAVSEKNWFIDSLDGITKRLSEEDFAYMNSLPDYDPKELALALKKESQQSFGSRSIEVWGTGTGNTVWKWNGVSWGQPNPAARLLSVEVAKNGDNSSVWGIGRNGGVWKWNGASWGQPNPAARLSLIAVHSSNIAFGIAWDKTLFVTTNGGGNWAPIPNTQNAAWISCGDYNNILSVSDTDGNLYKYNLFSGQFDPVNVPNMPRGGGIYTHATMFGGGVWAGELPYGSIRRSVDYVSFTNVLGGGAWQVSTNSAQSAWVIDYQRKIWRTTNSGASWSQPNSAARLDYISAAY